MSLYVAPFKRIFLAASLEDHRQKDDQEPKVVVLEVDDNHLNREIITGKVIKFLPENNLSKEILENFKSVPIYLSKDMINNYLHKKGTKNYNFYVSSYSHSSDVKEQET